MKAASANQDARTKVRVATDNKESHPSFRPSTTTNNHHDLLFQPTWPTHLLRKGGRCNASIACSCSSADLPAAAAALLRSLPAARAPRDVGDDDSSVDKLAARRCRDGGGWNVCGHAANPLPWRRRGERRLPRGGGGGAQGLVRAGMVRTGSKTTRWLSGYSRVAVGNGVVRRESLQAAKATGGRCCWW